MNTPAPIRRVLISLVVLLALTALPVLADGIDLDDPGRTEKDHDRDSYNTPIELSGCAAGNHESCRNAVYGKRVYRTEKEMMERQAFARSVIPPGVAPQQRYWSIRHPLGWSSGVYLSDLLSDQGEERFARFWRSELPLDSAFSEAMDMSLEDWTQRWAQAQIGIPEPGPGLPLGTALLGIVLAGVIVGGGAVLVNRRQIH